MSSVCCVLFNVCVWLIKLPYKKPTHQSTAFATELMLTLWI